MDREQRHSVIKTMYLAGATDAAIAFAVNMTIGGVRQIVRGMGLPLRQPQKSKLFGRINNSPLLATLGGINPRTAMSRLKIAKKIDMGTEAPTQKNLRGIGASVPKLRVLRGELAKFGIDIDAQGETVRLIRPGMICNLTYTDLAFLVVGAEGIKAIAEKINAGWMQKDVDIA